MKYYTTTTEFNCGIDLHARSHKGGIHVPDGSAGPEVGPHKHPGQRLRLFPPLFRTRQKLGRRRFRSIG